MGAINMLSDVKAWSTCLQPLGDSNPENITVQDLAVKLRTVFVQELLGEHRQHYEGFVSHLDIDYQAEAEKFREDKYYNSAIGNIMPLALSTALCFPIVVFTAQIDNPMYITPATVSTDTNAFVVYSSYGTGHYDAATPYFKEGNSHDAIRCSCGVSNKNSGRKSCMLSSLCMTRCKCYKSQKPCTSLCRCCNCFNPNGVKPPPPLCISTRWHSFQMDIPSSKRFAEDRGQDPSGAIWSDFESVVLYEINNQLEDVEDVFKLYNDMVYYSSAPYCVAALPHNVVFRSKKTVQVVSKLKNIMSHSL